MSKIIIEDYIGKKFNRLTILKEVNKDKNWRRRVEVKCDCEKNTIFIADLYKIKSGHTKSCGCLRTESIIERSKKYNTYNLTGEYGIGYTFKGEEFYFDLEDYDKIKDVCWLLNSDKYVLGIYKTKHTLMHNLIMNSLWVDHIHHDKNDNRKENLRIVTPSQNGMNSKGKGKMSKFGLKGIYWHKGARKWGSSLTKDGESIYYNLFENIEDSISAQIEAEKLHFGEHRYAWENDIEWDLLLEYEKTLKGD